MHHLCMIFLTFSHHTLAGDVTEHVSILSTRPSQCLLQHTTPLVTASLAAMLSPTQGRIVSNILLLPQREHTALSSIPCLFSVIKTNMRRCCAVLCSEQD